MERPEFIALLSQYYSGSPDAAASAALDKAINEHKEYRDIFEQLQWQPGCTNISSDEKNAALKNIWNTIDNTAATKPAPVKLLLRLATAAIVTGILLVTFFQFFYNKNDSINTWVEINTKPHENRLQSLADGTEILLAKASKLSYNKGFGVDGRKMQLTGYAYFDVATNDRQHLYIDAGKIIVEVKGTAFTIDNTPTQPDITIALTRGIVTIKNKANLNDSLTLLPGQSVKINNAPQSKFNYTLYKIPAADSIPGWDSTQPVYFKKQSLLAITRLMQKKYKTTITITNDALKTKKFSGMFGKETLLQALESLKISYPFQYTITNNEVLIR